VFVVNLVISDLKPDNIGFSDDGTLKLFDFGLVTCIHSFSSSNEKYEMTGCTGSLRYMAPEVALKLAYNEKVDVYSFGILLWQMARDRPPFKGLKKEEFMSSVVENGERPKLDKTWPVGFSQLLTKCWDCDPQIRPSFAMINDKLNELIEDDLVGWNSNHRPWMRSVNKDQYSLKGKHIPPDQSRKPVSVHEISPHKRHSNWF
jgi:serine/threonine protein kinase